ADCGKKMSSPRIIMIPCRTPYFALVRLTPFVSEVVPVRITQGKSQRKTFSSIWLISDSWKI
ncbi:hypothetical protein, partial [Streptococcus mutans]|uniref:hypothetical protein n=1 Tax=Streptococcus mutans TaxID=1309 RepID=UPI001C5BF11D